MVLESLINPIRAEKKPWEMFFIGLIYSSFAIIFSYFIFREDASLVAIFLTTLFSVPVMYGAIKLEEKKDLVIHKESFLLREHGKALSFFMFLFLGFVISFSLWFIFLPSDPSDVLFSVQTRDISRIEMISHGTTGNAVNVFSTFNRIFFNNLRVMVFSLLFALFIGFGAIFILTWNASVIGVAIGDFVEVGLQNSGFLVAGLALVRYLTHGIPEILAYFMAGLAGGIVSIAIIRHDFGNQKFKHIMFDSANLVIGSVLLLFFAALLEIFVTPLFF